MSKTTTLTVGEPEDQLRGPFEIFMGEVGQALGVEVVCTGETRLPGRIGKPDYAVHAAKLLAGYIELKAPGVGANPNRFTDHNRDRWKRFQAVPNLIYCDGNDWGLYRNGEAVRPAVRLSGDVASDGRNAVAEKDTQPVLGLLTRISEPTNCHPCLIPCANPRHAMPARGCSTKPEMKTHKE